MNTTTTEPRRPGAAWRALVAVGRIFTLTFAAVGVGALAGDIWLADALRGVTPHRPAVQFAPRAPGAHTRRAPDPADLGSALASASLRDFDTFVAEELRNVSSSERPAFLAAIGASAQRGDRLASRFVDAVARQSCRDLAALAGAPASGGGSSAACADAVAAHRTAGREPSSGEVALRLSQLAAVVEAGVAPPDIVRTFCDDVEATSDLPPRFATYLVEVVHRHCVPVGLPDGGQSDGGTPHD
ncbi:MAG: hypothetical protein Q7S02_05205 [bacterium]|nr:hypothetical protein [bacterium]